MILPEEFKIRMKDIPEYDDFIKSFDNEESFCGIRVNPKKDKYGKARALLSDFERVKWCNDGYYCNKEIISGKHPYHIAGLYYFQEPSAMSSVEALHIEPDDFVLDLCAAPGGKATQAGCKLSDDGLLVANEIIPKRAAVLAENIERFGFKNAIVTNESPENLSEKFLSFFDKIIVDAPCSGEGMFKKEPQAIEEWSINHTISCSLRQKHIMDCAYKMLKPGGMIAYSTCTFAPVENECVVAYMLEKYNDLTLVDTGLTGLSDGNNKWCDKSIDISLTKRIFPHKQKGEGHFVAVMKKSGNSVKNDNFTYKNDTNTTKALELYREFENKHLNIKLDGYFRLFADNLYLIPHAVNLDRIKVIRAGFHIGIIKKNRFEPSHSLCMALSDADFKNVISFSADCTDLAKYLTGDVIKCDLNGYTAVCVDGYPLGLGKASNGILKNHFPKHLRLH